MKIFCLLFAIILPASAALPAKTDRLKFDRMPLGNAVRILSSRFHAPVTIAARAATPVSGDFSAVGLRAALTTLADQAGLEVVPLGGTDAAGYLLRKPGAVAPRETQLGIAAGRRAILLQQRAQLVQAAADLAPTEAR